MPTVNVVDSHQARRQWRELLDTANAGNADTIVERHSKPVAALIPYEDYLALQEELDELRATRQAAATYERWKANPATARPYADIRAEMIKDGLLNDDSTEVGDSA
jgi:prevent-host-death family protein